MAARHQGSQLVWADSKWAGPLLVWRLKTQQCLSALYMRFYFYSWPSSQPAGVGIDRRGVTPYVGLISRQWCGVSRQAPSRRSIFHTEWFVLYILSQMQWSFRLAYPPQIISISPRI